MRGGSTSAAELLVPYHIPTTKEQHKHVEVQTYVLQP